ncbi:MAG: beta-hexosaminidase, partial [Rhodospirillaceae bacterium]|nr:beta-hexosaminidase [Rhodospirillaceae bacterium]
MAALFGCAGTSLSAEEKSFFKETNPLGFIIFSRNVKNPSQLKALIADLRETVGRENAPVLIDQEGG